jgi:hypothetical protein
MACALTSGYNFAGCKGGGSGISEVLITELANVTAIVFTSNNITTITMASGKVFRRYILDQEMGSFNDPLTYTKESGTITYEHQVDFTIKGLTLALKTEIKLIAQNTLLMIVKDRNGNYHMAGTDGATIGNAKGMDLMTADAPSGKALVDFNGFILSFRGLSTDYMHTVDSSIIAAII